MTDTIKLLTIAVAAFVASAACNAHAQNRETLSGRVSVSPRVVTPKANRTDDAGRPLKLWRDQHVYRRLNNTNVYQHRGSATLRHDEISSYAILVHKKPGQPLKAGHAYQNRGN